MSRKEPNIGKMATGAQVIDRLIWDNRLNSSIFIVGYINRSSQIEVKEKPLLEWNSQKDIPWHRIRYIRCGEVKVWDRDRRIDLISTGQLPDLAWSKNPQISTSDSILQFQSQTVYQYKNSQWQVSNSTLGRIELEKLKIVSFNVLCDWEKRLKTEQRIPEIIKQLETSNADIIALQEAHPKLLEQLLLQDWVLDYYISELVPERLKPYGLLLLSRLPFTSVEYEYTAHKRVIVGNWQINERSLQVAVVHLTSDLAKNAAEKREGQLSGLLDYLERQEGDCLIVGDFNDRKNQLTNILKNWHDIWLELRPGEKGYTFDPNKNTLAALTSQTNQPARFDRILLRKGAEYWAEKSIDLLGVYPIANTGEQLYLSDHFAVAAVLEAREAKPLTTIAPVYRSAVVIIPPEEILPAIQKIRRQFDRNFVRWMPHINLLYGFLPEQHFPEAAEKIACTLANFKPFDIALSGFNTFKHRKNCTAWLQPDSDPSDALQKLQATLESVFPQCYEQGNKSAAGFTPHLSVGQFIQADEAKENLPQWHPLTFKVESIYLISRRRDDAFEIRYQIDFGNQNTICFEDKKLGNLVDGLEPPLTKKQKEDRETITAIIAQSCQELLGGRSSLYLLGSSRLGTDSQNSDLDLLCSIPTEISSEKFLADMQQNLEGLIENSLIIKQARVPLLQINIEGVSLDLMVANCPKGILPTSPNIELDSTSWQAAIGYWEAETIIDTVSKVVDLELFQLLVRSIRCWAKMRHIHGQAWGFLGSFSWTLLAAYSCVASKSGNRKIEELLVHFFEMLAEYDWNKPIALTTAGKEYKIRTPPDWLPIVTSISPVQNSARNITRSTAKILIDEFDRATKISREILEKKKKWSLLFSEADLPAQSELFLVLKATSQENLSACNGWLKGNILGLIINLEKQFQLKIRPWNKIITKDNSSWVILGLQVKNNGDILAIKAVAAEFIAKFSGVIWDYFVTKDLKLLN